MANGAVNAGASNNLQQARRNGASPQNLSPQQGIPNAVTVSAPRGSNLQVNGPGALLGQNLLNGPGGVMSNPTRPG